MRGAGFGSARQLASKVAFTLQGGELSEVYAPDPRSLTYRQVTTTPRWRITKTYVTDPARAAMLVDVRFRSLTGRPVEQPSVVARRYSR